MTDQPKPQVRGPLSPAEFHGCMFSDFSPQISHNLALNLDEALREALAEVERLDASIESMMVLRAKWQHQLLTAESALSESHARVKVLEDALEDLKLCTTQGLRYPGTETLESLNSKCRKALAAILGGSDG